MDIVQLGAIGELIGGVAVIGSLIYVALQVRQGNEAARGETVRAFVADWNQQVLAPMSDPVNGPLLRRANANFEALNGDEKLAAHGIWTQMVFLAHELFELDAEGKVSESLKSVGLGAVASYLKAPGPAERDTRAGRRPRYRR